VTHAKVIEATDDGHVGYVHADGWRLMQKMAAVNTLVPATTRTTREFIRLRLPAFPTAVVANGGVVLIAGVPDPEWEAQTRASTDTAELEYAHYHLTRLLAEPEAQTVRIQENLFLTVTTRRSHPIPNGFDDAARAFASTIGYVVSRQHRKLYLTPAWLTKEAAAAHIADRLGADFTLAAGDATLDAGLLTWADEAMHPRHTADTLPGTPTTASGIDAGLELLTWAHTRIHGPADTTAVA